MEKLTFLNVNDARVYGIIHPMYKVYGNCDLLKYDFEIEVDGQVRTPKVTKDLVNNNFLIELKLDRTDKVIRAYILYDEQREFFWEIENKTVRRVKAKIRGILLKVLNKLKRILKGLVYGIGLFFKAIAVLWKETHFLVTPKKLKEYKKRLAKKLENRGNEELFYNFLDPKEYNKWLKENPEEFVSQTKFAYEPLISICIPVYNVERKYLAECIDSILDQTYQKFEICLTDDCSTNQETIDTLAAYAKKDARIKVFRRKENGHISKATNDALKMAQGEFIGLMDNDDILVKYALAECVALLNEDRTIDFIYTDEDKLDLNGVRREPHFKADYSPDTLLGSNYICHFEIMRKSIVDQIGGFRPGFEGAQDYDLFLRFVEQTTNIRHIPKILYRWRMIEGSTAENIDSKGYAVERGRLAVQEALERRGLPGTVRVHDKVPYYIVDYSYEEEPMISIIIPTKDYADITEQCLASLFEKTNYRNYEVLLMNNNSEKQETFDLFAKYQAKYPNFRVIDANYEFNYSKINNQGVREARGDYIVLLNNDTQIIKGDWLNQMVGYAMQEHIGIVGAKLLYPDDTVQHAGVILGIGGIAQHCFIGNPRTDVGFYGRLSVPFNYSAVTAACLMISKKKFQEVNGLEEKLEVAFNDVDFNLRVLEKGYYNVCLNQVELYHHESKSRGLDETSEKYKRFVSEHDYMKDRWGYLLYHDHFYNPNLSMKKAFVLDRK